MGDAAVRDDERLSPSTLVAFGLPSVALTTMHWLVMVFLLKFATDHLGLGPARVGALFAVARVWDAVSDPLAGWASDRTRSRFGRRRPWMIAGVVPLAFGFWALWWVPEGSSTTTTTLWFGFALLAFYAAGTVVKIPYESLGAELTEAYHERTRLSAARVGAEVFGIALAVALLHGLENAADVRSAAARLACAVGGLAIVAVAMACAGLRERPEHRERAIAHPFRAMLDVARNPHALRVGLAILLSEIGLGSLLATVPFVSAELSGEQGSSAVVLIGFAVPFAISVPLWVPIARRLGKVRAWALAAAISTVAFGAMGFLSFGNAPVAIAFAAVVGFGQGGLRSLPFAVKADVIDWDEARTGERKEGTYFAMWNLSEKVAGALSVLLVGFAIQGANGEVDPERLQLTISLLPAGLLAASTAVLMTLRFGPSEFATVRSAIASRRSAGGAAEALDASANRHGFAASVGHVAREEAA